MTTTARLVTRVDTKGAKKAERELKGFSNAANDSENKSLKLGKAARIAGKGIAALAVATAGAVTISSAFAISSAKQNRELRILSRQARTTTSDFMALAFATNSYGINGEQIADISKDIADKVGEFVTAGTGAFQDYADVMELSADQARELAKEVQNLSGEDALRLLTRNMEAAGATSAQMTFALESLGNDASRLLPLLIANGQELDTLKNRFDDATAAIQLTAGENQALADLASTTGILKEQSSLAAQSISAALAPVLNNMFVDIINHVPAATNALVDFFNTFNDAQNITSIRSVNELIEDQIHLMVEQEQRIDHIKEKFAKELDVEGSVGADALNTANNALDEIMGRYDELIAQRQKLEDTGLAKVEAPQIGGIAGGQGTIGVPSAGGGQDAASEFERLQERLAMEEDAITASYIKRVQIVANAIAEEGVLQEEHTEALMRLQRDYETSQSEAEQELNAAKLDALSGYLDQASGLMSSSNKEQFAIGKAAALANWAMTAPGFVTKAGEQAGIPGAIAAGVVAVAQLAQITKAKPPAREQGGSVFGGQGVTVAERNEPEIFIPKGNGDIKSLDGMGGNEIDVSVSVYMPESSNEPAQVETKIQGDDQSRIRRVVVNDMRNRNSDISKATRGLVNG